MTSLQRACDVVTGGQRDARAVLDLVEEVRRARVVVVPADADGVDVQHLAQLVADQLDDRLERERAGDSLLDAVDDGELGVALLGLLQQALGLVEQARVLERDTHARGDRLQQTHVLLGERVLALVVLQPDHAEHAVAADDGHAGDRMRPVGAGCRADSGLRLLGARVRHPRRASANDFGDGPARVERPRLRQRQRPVVLVTVEHLDHVGLVVPPGDVHVADAEDLAQLVADEVDHRLQVELGGNPLLDRIDHRELGPALFVLLVQAPDLGAHRLALHGTRRGRRSAPIAAAYADERGRRIGREGSESVALAHGEAAEGSLDVGVDEAEHALARNERGDDARALRRSRDAGGPMAQLRDLRAPRFVEPGHDRRKQRLPAFAAREARTGGLRSALPFAGDEDALRTQERRTGIEQGLDDLGFALQFGHGGRAGDQALGGLWGLPGATHGLLDTHLPETSGPFDEGAEQSTGPRATPARTRTHGVCIDLQRLRRAHRHVAPPARRARAARASYDSALWTRRPSECLGAMAPTRELPAATATAIACRARSPRA